MPNWKALYRSLNNMRGDSDPLGIVHVKKIDVPFIREFSLLFWSW